MPRPNHNSNARRVPESLQDTEAQRGRVISPEERRKRVKAALARIARDHSGILTALSK